jgi:hypothetical protein
VKPMVQCETQEELVIKSRRVVELLRGEVILHTRFVFLGRRPLWWAPFWNNMDSNGFRIYSHHPFLHKVAPSWYKFWRRFSS